jgi:IclR family acetate operon transcriptional repressor
MQYDVKMQNEILDSYVISGEERNPYIITSAYRTLQVLKIFSKSPHRYSLAELAGLLGIEKNQLYRSLKTLEKSDFLVMGSDGRFSLTSIIQELASARVIPDEKSIVEIAQPYLDQLANQTRESVNLFVRSGDLAICVDRRDSSYSVKLTSVLGMSVALHAGAVPKAMLAHVDTITSTQVLDNLANLPGYTSKTNLDRSSLEQELAVTRQRGYSISDEDFDDAARGVGGPIFNEKREVVAGISVGGPSFRVDDATLKIFGQLILKSARAISRCLGYVDNA